MINDPIIIFPNDRTIVEADFPLKSPNPPSISNNVVNVTCKETGPCEIDYLQSREMYKLTSHATSFAVQQWLATSHVGADIEGPFSATIQLYQVCNNVKSRVETKHSNITKLRSYQGLRTHSCAFECLHTYLYACALHELIIKWHLMVVRLWVQLVFLVRRFRTRWIITRRLTTEKSPV